MSRSSTVDRAAIDSRRVERVYSALSRVYDDAFDWALGPGRLAAVQSLPVEPGDRILEIGVGTGLSLPHYASHCHVTGIDISKPMLEHARQRVEALDRREVELRQMDARELRFPEGSFDHVVAPYVISVVPEPARVMQEIARVCRPGGTVVVVNHFHQPAPVLRLAEKALTPITQWIGFRLDVTQDVVLRTRGLRLIHAEPVNLLGLWHLLVMRRDGEAPERA